MSSIISMKPVIEPGARVLILGSMPGVESLKRQQYYGNPRNHFWYILGDLFQETIHNQNYSKKVDFLHRKRVAVWDVIASCERKGSLDSAIRKEEMNDLLSLVDSYPTLQWIGLNGTKAYQSFQKYLKQQPMRVSYGKLPSTSPVPGRNVKSYPEKVESWKTILHHI